MKIITTTIFLLALLSSSIASAQPRTPRIKSPEVHADRSITFRVKGPELSKAILDAPWAGEPTAMKSDDDGVWSVTVGPVDPQIYSYNYEIDGVSVLDPHNPRVKLWDGGAASLVEVPAPESTAYDWTARPHGDLHIHHFRSSTTDRERRVFVYTPPGYEAGRGSYPTLYLLHGSGDNECFWQLHLAHFGGLFWPPCKRASKSLISGHLLSFLGTWSGAEPEGRSAGRCPQKRAPSLLPPSLLLRQRPTKAVGLLARLDDVSAVGNAIQQRLT